VTRRKMAATTTVMLRPHREREQNQVRRRKAQPAPHNLIIAEVDAEFANLKTPGGTRSHEESLVVKDRDTSSPLWFKLCLHVTQ
jgi:hypothetical protein